MMIPEYDSVGKQDHKKTTPSDDYAGEENLGSFELMAPFLLISV